MASFTDEGHKTFPAGADLSTTGQYLLVKLNSSAQVILAAAAGDKIIGVLMNKPKSGENADVRLLNADGTSKAKAGGTIAIGDILTSDASGQVITATQTAAGSAPVVTIVGRAVKAAVSGDVVEFLPFTGQF